MSAEHHRTWLMPVLAAAYLDRLLEPIRALARVKGYAVAVHGSVARDIDLVAVPWTDDAASAEDLVSAVHDAVRSKLDGAGYIPPDDTRGAKKPHGRRAWTIILGSGVYIDLSVMPRQEVACASPT